MARKHQKAPAPETKTRNYASPATSTASYLDAIRPSTRPQYFPIYGCEGLFVGVTPLTSKGGGGVKSWRFQDKVEGGPKILLTLGRYGVGHLSMEAAKADADWARGLCRKGIDPRDHTAPSQVAPAELKPTVTVSGAVTFRAVAEDWFVAWVKARNSEATQVNQRWLLDKYVLKEFGDQAAETMTPKPVVRWLNGIAKNLPTTANRLRALISKLSNWAIAERDEIKVNLTTGYVKAIEDSEEEEGRDESRHLPGITERTSSVNGEEAEFLALYPFQAAYEEELINHPEGAEEGKGLLRQPVSGDQWMYLYPPPH